MVGFTTLLRAEGIDPTIVRLVRHQDKRVPGSPTPYQLWIAADGRFETYQSIQRRHVFGDARYLAAFVATPLDETLFVGMYEIKGVDQAPNGLIDPISGADVSTYNFYDLSPVPFFSEYRERLVIEWGAGYRSWVQLAANKNKNILEIRRSAGEPPFPGFLDFRKRLSELNQVPNSWREALRATTGIYLLVDPNPNSGKQYVGSACGEDGLWGRWEQYVASGHGGNRRMQDIPAADYQVSILEVASSNIGSEALLKMENRWKEKLLTRKFGLNAN